MCAVWSSTMSRAPNTAPTASQRRLASTASRSTTPSASSTAGCGRTRRWRRWRRSLVGRASAIAARARTISAGSSPRVRAWATCGSASSTSATRCSRSVPPGRAAVIVSHLWVTRALIGDVTGERDPLAIDIPTASVSVVDYPADGGARDGGLDRLQARALEGGRGAPRRREAGGGDVIRDFCLSKPRARPTRSFKIAGRSVHRGVVRPGSKRRRRRSRRQNWSS